MPFHRLLAILVVLALFTPTADSGSLAENDEHLRKITEAMPSRASAKPEKPRRLLVFSKCEGFAHGSIPTVETALRVMGEETGAFKADFATEMKVFTAENLGRYDAVLFNNTTRLKFENPLHREALLRFVSSGKGVIGIHAATDNFYDWPEAAAMMGGLFDGHPWGAGGTWAVKIDEPDHPLNRGFKGKGFLIKDEIYQIKGPYSRDSHRVLLSLDMSNPRNSEVKGIKRKDNDFAISWIRSLGRGRVFYCSLGHNHEVLWNSAVLCHYLDGIQYALGDLEADATPSARLAVTPKPALAAEPDAADVLFDAVRRHDFGKSRIPLSTIEEKIRKAGPEETGMIEARLLDILESGDATFAGKQFACRMLRRIGSEKSIPVLEKLLYNVQLTDAARFALQGASSPQADAALQRALDRLDGDLRIGVISTIGQRGDSGAVPRLAGFVSSNNRKLARAAISALGRIGGSEAASVLEKAKVSSPLEDLRNEARLQCADTLFDKGLTSAAAAICRELTDERFSPWIRVAAFRSLTLRATRSPAGLVLTLLRDSDARLRQAGGKLIGELPGDSKTAVLLSEFPTLPPDSQALVLAGFAARGDGAALPVAVQAAGSAEDNVRIAAFSALTFLGGASEVKMIAQAATDEGPAGRAASRSLDRISGPGVEEAMLEYAYKLEGPVKAELIRCLSLRFPDKARTIFLIGAMSGDDAVRRESLKALEKHAGAEEVCELLVLLGKTKENSQRRGIEKAILAGCRRMDADQRTDPILPGFDNAEGPYRVSLIRLLGQLPCAESLPPLIAALEDEDRAARDEAVRALAAWPDAAPMKELCRAACDTKQGEIHSMALEAFIRMAGLPSDRSDAETRRIFDTAMTAAADTKERRLVLNGAAGFAAPWALDFVEPYLKDEALYHDAADAKRRISNALARTVSHDAAGCPVTFELPFDKKYDGGGKNALTDGKWGSHDHGDGRWQGFKEKDMTATIDFGRAIEVRTIRAAFLENTKSWVFLPREVVFSLSMDGSTFQTVATMREDGPAKITPPSIHDFVSEVGGKPARYLRVHAASVRTCPEWHPGSGGSAWLFADEIQVNPHFEASREESDETPW